MAGRPELQVESGELAGRRYAVGEGGLRLGRSSSNDIHLSGDEELSRNHCLFEAVGDEGLRVTDLASANGTYVNGRQLGNDPTELHVGDRVEVGRTVVLVVGDGPSSQAPDAGSVDLGLGGDDASTAKRRRNPIVNILWAVTAVVLLAAIAVVLLLPRGEAEPPPKPVAEEKPEIREVVYEKIEANSDGIFRYELTLSPDGVLSVSVDDMPKNERRFTKSQPIDGAARAALNEILAFARIHELDREYVGPEPDPPALDSCSLKVVYSTRVRSVRVVNTQEPEAFRMIREKLEAFSKNQLGVWAIQYSRDKLVALAEESIALAKSKWDEREVNHGNLHGAVVAYREAIFYLETVSPKPECAAIARQGLDEALAELERRYRDQRFLADRAISLGQWEVARRELAVLLEMVPDRNDDRHREAESKLLDVERRLKGGK